MSLGEAPLFDAAGLRGLLDEVDNALGPGKPIEVVACGGAVMLLKYDIRRTNDVDVISEPFPDELRRAAQAVGERHHLRDEWMNDAAKTSIPKLTPRLEAVYSGQGLTVLSPGPHFLLAMKLAAGRCTLQVGLSPLVMLLAADFRRWGGVEPGATPPGCLGCLFAIPLSSQQ